MKSKKTRVVLKGRAAGVLLEDIDAKLDLIVEKVEGSEQRLTERMDKLDVRMDRLEVRMDRIEAEIVGIRVLLGQQGEILKRHDEDIVFLKQASVPH